MIKINALELENVKRVKAVKLEPASNGLTVIGGKNNQGKTSVLDAISWALGGNSFRPSQPTREGSVIPPRLHVVLSNGLIVERNGKNSDLKVIDPDGRKGGQQLLNEFISQLALDLPKFLQASSKEKAHTLLHIIGVEDQINRLERQEQELYNRRRTIGQIADQKTKFAKELPYFPDAPKKLISVGDLIHQQQEILARNGENQRKRNQVDSLQNYVDSWKTKVEDLKKQLEYAESQLAAYLTDFEIAQKSILDLHDESTEELEKNINDVEAINRKVRINLDKEKAEEDALQYQEQYKVLTAQIEQTRKEKTDLLCGADLPLPGLSVENGELTYNGQCWDNMSGSDQLRVATAIVRRLNPNCGFVLLDKLEQMDLDTMEEFGKWLEEEGLQAIATRVSTGDECSVIIEDGYVKGIEPFTKTKTWKAGEF